MLTTGMDIALIMDTTLEMVARLARDIPMAVVTMAKENQEKATAATSLVKVTKEETMSASLVSDTAVVITAATGLVEEDTEGVIGSLEKGIGEDTTEEGRKLDGAGQDITIIGTITGKKTTKLTPPYHLHPSPPLTRQIIQQQVPPCTMAFIVMKMVQLGVIPMTPTVNWFTVERLKRLQ